MRQGQSNPAHSEFMKRRWTDPAYRQQMERHNKRISRLRWRDPEQREAARERRLGKPSTSKGCKWSSEAKTALRAIRKQQYTPKVRRAVSRRSKQQMKDPKVKAAFIAAGRGRPSRIEVKFLNWFEKKIGCPVERGVSIGGYVVDGKVGQMVVEVDGTYWHSMPGRKAYDRKRDKELRSSGYAVFHVSDVQARRAVA